MHQRKALLRLQAAFEQMDVMVIAGSYWRGTQDRGELVFERLAFNNWRERFDQVAQRLGYVVKKGSR